MLYGWYSSCLKNTSCRVPYYPRLACTKVWMPRKGECQGFLCCWYWNVCFWSARLTYLYNFTYRIKWATVSALLMCAVWKHNSQFLPTSGAYTNCRRRMCKTGIRQVVHHHDLSKERVIVESRSVRVNGAGLKCAALSRVQGLQCSFYFWMGAQPSILSQESRKLIL